MAHICAIIPCHRIFKMAALKILVFALSVISVQSAPINPDDILPFWTISPVRDYAEDARRAQLDDLLKDNFPLLKREIDELKTDERYIIEKLRGSLSDAVKRGEISRQDARDVILEIVKAAKENKLGIFVVLKALLNEGVKEGIIDRNTRLQIFVNAILERIHKKSSDSSEAIDKALAKAVDAEIIPQETADELKELVEKLNADPEVLPELLPYSVLIGGRLRDAIKDILSGHGKIIDNFRDNFRNAIKAGILSKTQVAEVMREIIRAIRLRKLNVIGRINELLDKGVEEGIIDSDTRLQILLKSIRERIHENEPNKAAAIEATIEGAKDANIISGRTAKKLKELAPAVDILEEELLPF